MTKELTALEEIFGVKIEEASEQTFPDLHENEEFSVLYFKVLAGEPAKAVFRKITRYTGPPFAQTGGVIEAGFSITTPDGSTFHALEFHGDLSGWKSDIQAGASAHNILLAKIEDNHLICDDGQSFSIENCKISF